jgi:hypothetical protein
MTAAMNSRRPISLRLLLCTLAAAVAVAAAQPAFSAAKVIAPRVSTGGAQHVLGTSALLTASILPNGIETSYYFQYGTTTAYGLQTPTVGVGAGTTRVPVGQAIVHLTPGAVYHFRVVAIAGGVQYPGHDRVFTAKGVNLVFVVSKTAQDIYGSPFILSGTLTGTGSALHRVALQASPFPFLESFAVIGSPGVTNAKGAFSFRVANLEASTQLRVTTLDPLPIYSPVITAQVVPRIALHVRTSRVPGVVRLYGTITPAVNGAKVALQVLKAVRPGANEVSERWVNAFATVAKKGPGGTSRFSIVATVRHGGRYRAYVKMAPRAKFASGPSLATVVLHAAPASALRKHK